MAGCRRVSRQEEEGRTHRSSFSGGTGQDAEGFLDRRNREGRMEVPFQEEQDRKQKGF
jgi:hypothetical protein